MQRDFFLPVHEHMIFWNSWFNEIINWVLIKNLPFVACSTSAFSLDFINRLVCEKTKAGRVVGCVSLLQFTQNLRLQGL